VVCSGFTTMYVYFSRYIVYVCACVGMYAYTNVRTDVCGQGETGLRSRITLLFGAYMWM